MTSEFKTFAKAQVLHPHSSEWNAAWNAWIDRDAKFNAVAQIWHDTNAELESKLKRLKTGPVKHAHNKRGANLCGSKRRANQAKPGRLCQHCARLMGVKV